MVLEFRNTRRVVNGFPVIEPYFYYRNGLLHVRYTVDKCVELSPTEQKTVKEEMSKEPYNKQAILEANWKFFTEQVGKPVIEDGIAEAEKRMKELSSGYKNN